MLVLYHVEMFDVPSIFGQHLRNINFQTVPHLEYYDLQILPTIVFSHPEIFITSIH